MSLFKLKPMTTTAEKIDAFQSTVCTFNAAVPLVYGTSLRSPFLINYQDFESKEKRESQGSGKAKQVSVNYDYYAYLELAVCDTGGDAVQLGEITVGDKTYSSLAEFNASDEAGSGLDFNDGTVSDPTPYMIEHHEDKAVPYDGLAYLYGKAYLGENSASVPSYSLIVKGRLREDGDGIDANPADVIRDLLTIAGMGEAIDENSFGQFRLYCKENDLLVSTPRDAFNDQKKAQEVIAELLEICDTYMFISIDKFKFVPRDDQDAGVWRPNRQPVYDLTDDDFILQGAGAAITYEVRDGSEIYNRHGVSFTNRANSYESEVIWYEDTADILENGVRAAAVFEAPWIHTKERAVKIAKRRARKNLLENVRYTVKLPYEFMMLEPGDLVTLTNSVLDLNRQPCMVDTVTIGADKIVTVTAIKRPAGEYAAAQYDVHSEYNTVDYNVDPGNSAAPLFIIPPSDLVTTSASGLEIWVLVHGQTKDWGGCQVWVSDKDSEYNFSGTAAIEGRYGSLKSALTATGTEATIKFSNPNRVALLVGSAADAERGNTLIWINGECMSYSKAEPLEEFNAYKLSGLVRGQYGTRAKEHAVNEAMGVLDAGVYVVSLTKHYAGREMYFKFPAFNVFRGNLQQLQELTAYSCRANAADLPDCTGITAFNRYRELADDVTRYDIEVTWQPADFDSYQAAQVWYKQTGSQGKNLRVIPEGVAGSELGYTGKWLYAGSGYNAVTIPQAVVGDTYKIAVCTQDIYNNTEGPDMSPQVELLVAMKSELPDTPANVSVSFGAGVNISWNEVRNADIKYYEIRTVQNTDTEPIFSTTETSCTLQLGSRSGSIYVCAVSAYGKRSVPAMVKYNKPAPAAPRPAAVTAQIQGLAISMQDIPNDCYKLRLKVNTDIMDLEAALYHYDAAPGVYTVSYCFIDCFGAGPYSVATVATVEAYIPPELLAAESFNYERMSEAAKNAIADAATDNINVAVKGMLGNGTALVMQEGGYALVTSNGQKLTGLFADEAGALRLQGDYIHLTGNTVFDENVIIKGHMTAGSVSCDDGVSIAAGAVSLNDRGMQVQCSNGSQVSFNDAGMQFVDNNGNVFGAIGRFKAGTCKHNDVVTLNWDMAPKSVLMIPTNLKTYAQGYDNVYVKCFAANVTAASFKCQCYTTAAGGTASSITTASNVARVTPSANSSETRTLTTTTNTYNMPAGATLTNLSIDVSAEGFYKRMNSGGYLWTFIYLVGLYLDVYVNEDLSETITLVQGDRHYYDDKYSGTATAVINHPAGARIGIRSRLEYVVDDISYGSREIVLNCAAGTLTPNITGDTVIATGEATYFVFA